MAAIDRRRIDQEINRLELRCQHIHNELLTETSSIHLRFLSEDLIKMNEALNELKLRRRRYIEN
jgi:hypothetical protein